MRIGVMGGTFDPIHHGHLVAASEVGHFFELDEVIFVPTGQPWQKDARKVSEAEDRYLMTVIATASNPRFSVSRADIDRPGDTYTIDTLRDLHAARGPAEFFFITGADALRQLMSWQDADELFKLAHFVGCTRPGHRLSGDGLPLDKVSLIEIPALAISSTACRERVGAGQPIWYLVPDGIVQYIAKRRLYQRADGSGPVVGASSGASAPGLGAPRAGARGAGASGAGASGAGASGAFRADAADSRAIGPDPHSVGADPGPAWPEPADRNGAAGPGQSGPPGPGQRAGSE